MNPSVTFSIIIVHWNTLELTRRCILSIYAKNLKNYFEIILIDNASTDESGRILYSEFPEVNYIRSEESRGFAAANNSGIALAKGEYIILLNSDTEMQSHEPLAKVQQRFDDDPSLGILGAALYFPDGRLQACGRSFLTLGRLIKQQLLFVATGSIQKKKDKFFHTDYVDGAFLCITRSSLEHISPLDERYTMYAEDMEWCHRAWSAGFTVAVDPTIRILHHRGGSSKKRFANILFENALNNCRFLNHTESFNHAKIGYNIYLIGMLFRIPIAAVRRTGLARDYYKGFLKSLRMRKQLKDLWR